MKKLEAVQKQTEEALQNSKDRYQALFDRSLDCLYVVDFEGRFIDANPAALSLLGYERADIPFLNISSLLHKDSISKGLKDLEEVIQTGFQKEVSEYKLVCKNGKFIDVETQASVIFQNGKPHSVLGIARDITERKRADEALRQSEEKYRNILESIEEGYYEADLAGNLTFLNDSLARIRGYSREEMMGMNNREYTDAENTKIIYRDFNRVYQTGEPSKGTVYEVITKNGGRKNVETSISLIRDSSGRPVGFRGIVRDITELRQIQKALLISEDRYRDLVESSQDLMCTHDLTGKILWVNEEPIRILGYDKDFVLKMNIRDFLFPERKAEFDEYLAIIKSQGVASGLLATFTANGEKRIWEYRNTLRTEGVSEPIVRGMARDVTERIQAETKVRETVKKLRKAMGGIIQAMALTIEIRDPYTAGHQRRVADLARSIAQGMGLSEDQVDGIRMAGVVHDLGKIAVPAEILSKSTELNKIEFDLIKIHPQTSFDILKDIDFPWPVAQIVLQHHERVNGSGYPLGLSGEDICLEARILAVADVVEAICSHRPFRPAKGIEKALEEISTNKGILYDPEAVDACLRLFNEKGYAFQEKKRDSGE
jgi:PAS domain S-box-containing protein